MEEGPVLLRVSFRGASTTIGTTPDVELDELERVLAALFLSPQERAAGIKPVGFALPQDCFVSLRTACSDLPLVSALDDSVKLLVSFPSGDDSSDEDSYDEEDAIQALTEFFASLASHGFLSAKAASDLSLALRFPQHRAALYDAYQEYLMGELPVDGLKQVLQGIAAEVAPAASSDGLPPDSLAAKVAKYVQNVAADGFLSPAEARFITDLVSAGNTDLLALYAHAQRLGDTAVLNRGLTQLARRLQAAQQQQRDREEEEGGGDALDLDSNDEDDDDEGDEDEDEDDSDEDEDEEVVRSTSNAAPTRVTSRPSNPTPSASELIHFIDQLDEDGSISTAEAQHLRHLASIEDDFVSAAFEVYEQDPDHDVEELKDTLIRIAKWSTPNPSSATDTSVEVSLFEVVEILGNMSALSKSESAIVSAAVEFNEPVIIEALLAFYENNSVAQFRSALNSYLQSAGVVTADTPSTAAAVGGKFSDDNEDEDETNISSSHEALVSSLLESGLISEKQAILLLTLQAQGDPAIRAAWEVYVQSRDIEDLVDTMLRIIQRESSSISVEEETSQLRQRAIRTLVRLKKLSGPVGDALIGVLASRDDKVLAAAFETFEEDGDVDELVETLIVFHRQKLSSKGTSAQHPDLVDKAFISVCRSLYESGSVKPEEAHGLVELMHARDPRILAARDVFAAGRDEEELRDTLTLIAKLSSSDPAFLISYGGQAEGEEGEEENISPRAVSSRRKSQSRRQDDTLIDTLERVFAAPCEDAADEFSSDAVAALVSLAHSSDPALLAAADVYHSSLDMEDFRDSLHRIASLSIASTPSQPAPYAFSDGDRSTLKRVCRAAQFSEDETQGILTAGSNLDENVIGALQVFAIEGDFDDLLDSIRRINVRSLVASSPSKATRFHVLSDLLASGALDGSQYKALLRLVRAEHGPTLDAFAQYSVHKSRPALAAALSMLAYSE